MNQPRSTPAIPARFDGYADIHKALRAAMSECLVRLGCLDPRDTVEVAEVLGEVRELLAICDTHRRKEDHFIHPALEARRPGSSAASAADHAGYGLALELLAQDAAALDAEPGAASATALYRRFAAFVGENLCHMAHEEEENNRILWADYTDEELAGIERDLIASLQPWEKAWAARWMMRGMAPQERVRKLADMRCGMPSTAFAQILGLVQKALPEPRWRQLAEELEATA